MSFDRTPSGGNYLQIPEVATLRVEGGAVLKPGRWLLLSGPKNDEGAVKAEAKSDSWKDWLLSGGKSSKQRQTQEIVLMLRAEKIQHPRTTANGEIPASARENRVTVR